MTAVGKIVDDVFNVDDAGVVAVTELLNCGITTSTEELPPPHDARTSVEINNIVYFISLLIVKYTYIIHYLAPKCLEGLG
jgi:hypothetical protein